jgi:DNA-binding transcriptional ArsR family regulator
MLKINIEEKILKSLKRKKEQNILDLAENLAIDRHTVAKYLEVLKSKGLVKFSAKGKSKIWSLNDNELSALLGSNDFVSSQVLGILNKLDFDVSIQSKNYDIIWHNSSSEKGKCYEVKKGKKVPCKNCPSDKVFQSGASQKTLMKRLGCSVLVLSEPIKNEKGEVIAVLELTKNEKIIGDSN